jgi:glycosyltransferase involved in cell wall biosynthesis
VKVLLCDPFAYSEDYNRPLLAALRATGLDVEYLTSENVYMPEEPEGVVPGRRFFFLRRSKDWLRRRILPPSLVKAFGTLEYALDMARLYRKAVREGAVVHLLWIGHPAIDLVPGLLLGRLGRFVYTMHNAFPHDRETFLNKLSYFLYYRLPDQIIALCQPEIDRVLALDRGLAKRMNLIPHGLLFLDVPERAKAGARAELSMARREKVVLFWGNILPYKGLDDLLTAFARLRDPGFKLAVAGKWSMPDAEKQRLLRRARADGRLTLFEGVLPASRVRDLLCAADLLILPYKRATQSGVGFTALRYGLPLVVTRTGSLPELLPEDLRGRWVVPPESPAELCEAISAFFTQSDGERAALGARLRSYATARFSWDEIASRTLEVYRRVDRR